MEGAARPNGKPMATSARTRRSALTNHPLTSLSQCFNPSSGRIHWGKTLELFHVLSEQQRFWFMASFDGTFVAGWKRKRPVVHCVRLGLRFFSLSKVCMQTFSCKSATEKWTETYTTLFPLGVLESRPVCRGSPGRRLANLHLFSASATSHHHTALYFYLSWDRKIRKKKKKKRHYCQNESRLSDQSKFKSTVE